MKSLEYRMRALEKLAYGYDSQSWCPTVGVNNPKPTVGSVLDAIGLSQALGIGTRKERTDAFGRIIDSGLYNSSPAGNALKMLGGGLLGRAITGAFTKKPLIRGIGAGLGALMSSDNF